MSFVFSTAHPSGIQLPLAQHRVFETPDPDAMLKHLEAALWPHRMIRLGIPNASFIHHRARLADTWLNLVGYGCESEIEGSAPDDTFMVTMVVRGSCHLSMSDQRDDRIVHSGDIFMSNPGTKTRVRISGNFCNLTLQFRRPKLEQLLAADADKRLPTRLAFSGELISAEETGLPLAQLMMMCCRHLDFEKGQSSALSRNYERLLMSLVLNAIPHNLTKWMSGNTVAIAPYYVRRAEEFVHGHASESLTLRAIAQAAGVSERSLHQGFRDYRNTTPLNYLKLVRLERVREQLIGAADRGQSVADVASEHGFNHMSKFSASYRAKFGELPSDTWRRGRPIFS